MDELVSPEVHPDRRVTFRVRAPKASEVSLFGDWMTPNTQQAMTRDEQGFWNATTAPLEPGLAIYTFTVDGVTTPDPVNPRIKLRARTSASLVDVPGRPPELWEARHSFKHPNPNTSEFHFLLEPPGYPTLRPLRDSAINRPMITNWRRRSAANISAPPLNPLARAP